MRRIAAMLLTCILAGVSAMGSTGTVGAQGEPTPTLPGDVPEGFTDGVPVGEAPAPDQAATAGDPGAAPAAGSTRAATQRYFGRTPWRAIEAAAAGTSRPCSLSDAGLTALTVAPVFKESSSATSASTAPSPMTLSRYDEWTGTRATDTNRNANYGLYAFRDPSTSYKRAFWHPGIGIWQYDSAGVGAPFTAVERMDVGVTARDVAAGMAARYCSPSSSLIGHGAPFTGQERRNAAWAPWGYPCTLCEQQFQAMTATTPDFTAITLVDGISVTGGAQKRTCTLVGVAGTVTCWYIDPRVGVIQGATGWASIAPLDGGSSTVTPTPLAAPFYVVDRGSTEERHWFQEDTGYRIDISGSRQIGKNERPRSNQPGSGVTWRSSTGLCDLSTQHGACVPQPPSGINLTGQSVSATFKAVALDGQGDGKGDILWYAPGSGSDYVWSGNGSGSFTSVRVSVSARYDDVLPLDVDGDGDDDVLWYDRTTGARYLWLAEGLKGFRAVRLSTAAGLRPQVVDTDGDGRDEVFWYGPGTAADSIWRWTGSAFTSKAQSVSGGYLPLVGDFDGNGRTDIIWYAPGSAPDTMWLATGFGTHRSVALSASGLYWPFVGDFDGNGSDDVFWYGPGTPPDGIWFATPFGFTKAPTSVSGSYQPAVADLGGDGRDDVLWYRPGGGSDVWWRWSSTRTVTSTAFVADGTHQAIVGGFSAGGEDGVFWYAPGAAHDGVWWR